MKTSKQRQQEMRKRRKELGYRRREFYLSAREDKLVCDFVEHMRSTMQGTQPEQLELDI